MLCSNCGKDIPSIGNVCPYCHADKSFDKARESAILIGGFVGAAVGGIIGWKMDQGSPLSFVVILAGTAVGGIIGAAIGSAFARSAPKSRIAPTVQAVSPTPPPAHVMDSDEEKTCPFCAETIKRAAIKCRHCGSDLVNSRITLSSYRNPEGGD